MTYFDSDEAVYSLAALYLVGALDPAQEVAFERHVAYCRTCQREFDEIGPLVSGLSQLPDEEVAALLGDDPADRPGQPGFVEPAVVLRERAGTAGAAGGA